MEHAIGGFLKELRLARRLSINRLAQTAGVSQPTLSRWEAGKHQPSLSELDAALDALGASDAQRRRALALLHAPRAVARLREMLTSPAETTVPVFGGDLLRAMRLRRDMTLEEVARAIQVQPRTVSRWERSESWPTTEMLHELCWALKVHPEEVVALTQHGLHLTPIGKDVSLDALKEQPRVTISQWLGMSDSSLYDLQLLALQAAVEPLVASEPSLHHILGTVWTLYAQCLVFEGRLREAVAYAYRSFDVLQKEASTRYLWAWDLHVIAKDVALVRTWAKPKRGVEVLGEWLPAMEGDLRLKCWFLRDMADYMSLSGDVESALRVSAQAYAIANRDDGDFRNNQLDHARILVRAGQPQQALPLLSEDESPLPLDNMRDALLWAETLLALGDKAKAQDWLRRAYDITDRHDLWRLRPEVDALARRV